MNRKRKERLQQYKDILCYIMIAVSMVALMWAALVSMKEAVSDQEPEYPLPDAETESEISTMEIGIPVEIRVMSANTAGQEESESIIQTPLKAPLYEQSDIVTLAKLMFVECGSVSSDTEKACVVWTVLNRVDAWDMSIQEVVESANQFAYSEQAPISAELYELATDVLNRWSAEKIGLIDIGRVLPKEYMWFWGDGEHNHFRDAYNGAFTVWDYSLPSPYEN